MIGRIHDARQFTTERVQIYFGKLLLGAPSSACNVACCKISCEVLDDPVPAMNIIQLDIHDTYQLSLPVAYRFMMYQDESRIMCTEWTGHFGK